MGSAFILSDTPDRFEQDFNSIVQLLVFKLSSPDLEYTVLEVAFPSHELDPYVESTLQNLAGYAHTLSIRIPPRTYRITETQYLKPKIGIVDAPHSSAPRARREPSSSWFEHRQRPYSQNG